MWATKRKASSADALLGKLRARQWKAEAERDELLKSLGATNELAPEDFAFLAVESDAAMREAGLTLLKRHPWEAASEALFPFFASKTEAVRRQAMQSLEQLAGGAFFERLQGLLSHSDPAVVGAALDYLKRNPNEKALPWLAKTVVTSPSPGVRRRAFSIVEATPSPRAAPIAAAALDSDDEELRFRAVALMQKFPDENHIPALLRHCRNDSTRVQDASIAAIGPLLASSQKPWTEEVLPLLSDTNPKVRQLASRIAATQQPAKIAAAFLHAFKGTYGPAKDRAVEALSELGPQYLRAFLDRAQSDDPDEANLAASIAVTIRSPEAVPHCVRFLTGEDWWLRDRAALALAEIRDESTLPHLIQLLKDPESNLSAAAALGLWGTPKALPSLLEAYKQPDSQKDLRLEILDAFSRIDDPRISPLLQKIVQLDPDPLVRDKASRLVRARTGSGSAETASGSRTFEPVDFSANPAPSLADLLRHARAMDASDLHLMTGTVPQLRVHGRLGPLPLPLTSAAQMEQWLGDLLTDEQQREFESRRQLDFCHKHVDLGRFRTNVFFQRLGKSAILRVVPYEVPSVHDIGLPESLWEITGYSQGLILVTGPASCGKTTTLAALVDRINETERGHIITVEDPIEYVHKSKESLINQREIPAHSESFAKALRQSLREDPDVILVGEMRDLETISLAITASETGHLVLATLHTTTASSTVDRIINAFPPDQQGQIRMMVSDSLKAVLSQTLVPRRDGRGRVAAFEILRNTPAVGGLIRDGKTFQIPTAIQTGSAMGMQLMDGALLQLVHDGTIEARVAYDRALRKEAFEPFLQEAAS
jgi:twitching motility protein PilT